VNIPRKYGGRFDFEFGMPPDLDSETRDILTWLPSNGKADGEKYHDLPMGPMRWRNGEAGKRTAIAVGKVDGKERKVGVMTLDARVDG
jgi:hypothetical protein